MGIWGLVDAIVVDPDIDTRMRLKQAATVAGQFGKVHQIGGFRDAMSRLSGEDNCDVIFVSQAFGEGEVGRFVQEAKTTKNGQDSAYILVLKSKGQEHSQVAKFVLWGADGLLFEPYSAEKLVEITEIAQRVKKERKKARLDAAFKILVNKSIEAIDAVAALKIQKRPCTLEMKNLKEATSILPGLDEESLENYYEHLIETFTDIQRPRQLFQKRIYTGASKRVKSMMKKKIEEELGPPEPPKTGAD